jgi:uncharacterized protein YkwD
LVRTVTLISTREAFAMRTLNLLAAVAGTFLMATAAQAGSSCVVPPNAAALMDSIGAGLNQFRQSQSLGSVRENRDLTQAALIHACDMAVNNYFDHRGSDGSNSDVRVRQAGYHNCLVAENLAWGFPEPGQILSGWANSPGHRRNMLLPNARDFGVGVVEGPRGPLWVLVMARPC